VWDVIRSRLKLRWPSIVAAFGVTLFAWPIDRQTFDDGIDPSWQYVLHESFHDRVPFDHVLLARGPLGFVNAPHLYFFDTWVLAVLANLLVAGAVAYTVIRLVSLRLSLVWSVVIALPLVLVFNTVVLSNGGLLPEVALILLTVWACHLLSGPTPVLRLPHVVALAVVAATIMLVKLNVGLAAVAVLAYLAAAIPLLRGDRRTAGLHVATLAGTALISVPLLWMVVGQPISALPGWLGGTYEISRGYSEAMGIEIGGAWEYAAALLVIAVIVGTLATTNFSRSAQRWVLIGLVILVSFVLFKDGFVRHDAHSVQLFGLFALLPLAFLPRWTARQALVLVLAPVVALFGVADVDLVRLVAPRSRIDAIGDFLHLARSDANRDAFVDGVRRNLRTTYDIPPDILDRLRDGDVAVTPWELAVANAYPEYRWREFPVIQAYNAYTDDLDHRNAEFLAKGSRPRFILNEPGIGTDGRFPRFESPEAVLQRLCHYRVASSSPRWQLLEETSDRCGKPEEIRHQSVGRGDVVNVPPPTGDSIVVVRFDGIADGTFDSLRTLLYKGREVWMRVNDDTRIRFLPGHQHAFHVLAAPVCATPQMDGENFERMKLTDRDGDDSEAYGVTFFRVPFSC
jgi:hypothetical protein